MGVGVGYAYSSNESETASGTPVYDYSTNLFSLTPYVRKYTQLKENLFFTTSLNLQVGVGKNKYGVEPNREESDVFAWGANITPGLTYFISNQWAITANVGQLFFNYKKEKGDTDSLGEKETVRKDFGASFQFNTFGIGVQYYLRNTAE